ncbi:MAG: DNA-directed DNA polymerase II small subunit [Candidatus Methylarchaceae archaeon HK02M2]|nr:DNA-directed DNA polymerase II small subunit [Candidatus Methylarchaceae archaeon HK02M2]
MHQKKVKLIIEALANGYQLDPEAFNFLSKYDEKISIKELLIKLNQNNKQNIITKQDLIRAFPSNLKDVGSTQLQAQKILPKPIKFEYKIIKDPTNNIFPITGIRGFKNLFRSRFEKLLKIVKERPDSYQIKQISNLKKDDYKKFQKIAGLVMDKKIKRSYVVLTLDDMSGKIKIIALDRNSKKNAIEICLDQLVIVDLKFSKKGLAIIRDIYSPDIPEHLPNRSENEVYAIFTSDTHVGSNTFLFDAFNKFILWLNGKNGDNAIVNKVRYLIIAGDIVDGIGIYPNQDKELSEVNIYEQYKKFIEFIKQIPKHIKIFIIPGNHDPVRQALPQPAIPDKYVIDLYNMENVSMLGNPVYLCLHGINILVCHGRSLDDIHAKIPGLTFSNPASAMKILLKARHLAPIYGERTPIAQEQEDHLVIEQVPDILHLGHVHTVDIDNYRGTLLINSGTWQGQTSYQLNMGLTPTPGIVPIVNLKTLEVKLKNFIDL